MKKEEIIQIAKQSIQIEKNAIDQLMHSIDDEFVVILEKIIQSEGRLIVSGIGKSAIIAQKMVATFNSTGTPAIFMHAADAIHGDLGIILENDIVILISKSGSTPEIKALAPLIKNLGNTLIGMVSDRNSYLATQSNHILYTPVDREACPNNLAPTTSTTSQMVLGDALAIALLEYRGFTSKDFAKVHPGGALGKKLYMRVFDLYQMNESPSVSPDETIQKTIIEISSKRLGATAVVDTTNKVLGIITDGDIRRMLEKHNNFSSLLAKDIMSPDPRTIDPGALATEAFQKMESNNITQLIVSDGKEYLGMIHLHDILKEGIV